MRITELALAGTVRHDGGAMCFPERSIDRFRADARRLVLSIALLGLLAACSWAEVLAAEREQSAAARPPAIAYYDLTPLLRLDLSEADSRRRFWDECHLVFALQGIVNRDGPRLFVRWIKAADDFWWAEMTRPGGWLAGRDIHRIESLELLLDHFAADYRGAVLWDERVPATSNLASTLAGCDDLLPVRHDEAPGSLGRQLLGEPRRIPVRTRLLHEDGSPLFTGRGTIAGTTLPSSGSAKADAYLWLVEHHLKTGQANPQRMGYYLDAFWLQCWHAAGPENHTLSNHDFVIARRGVLFDLGVWDDEPSVDDPGQKPGTDVATLKALLRAAYDRFGGEGMIHVAGFVPWAYKYTDFKNARWSAGGRHEAVPTEWRYAEILSCYNAFMDADALGLGAMANASFFQHYPLAARYPQNPKPTRADLQARGFLDADGHVVPRGYVAHYVGDYDAAAWLYRELPRLWSDPQRGATPLSWAFNPNLAERFPLGMAWARERRSTNDFFVAGDSGAGYLNPGNLTPPRAHSGLPSGLAAWERHCQHFYRQWDLSLTGFVIDGYAPGLQAEGLDAYSRFSPDGIVAQKIPARGVHRGMPFLRMRSDVDGPPAAVARSLHSLAGGSPPKFVVVRSILKSPTWYSDIARELRSLAGDSVQVVDLHTLLALVREVETNPQPRARSPYADATEILVTPSQPGGLRPIRIDDGPFDLVEREGVACWRVARHAPPRYFYFDVEDDFAQTAGTAFEIELEFLDRGTGLIELHYDSRDANAALEGAYKPHTPRLDRRGEGGWRKQTFLLHDARFAGRQNGETDFRFYSGGDDLLVRAVRVRKVRPR